MSPFYRFGRGLLMPFYKLLFWYKINGRENVPNDGAYIVCSNHLSNNDPVLLGLAMKRQIFYMAKAELFRKESDSGLGDKTSWCISCQSWCR